VSRKRDENSISYGFYGLAPSAQAASPQAAVYSPKALASDEAVGKRQEYFETATSAVQCLNPHYDLGTVNVDSCGQEQHRVMKRAVTKNKWSKP